MTRTTPERKTIVLDWKSLVALGLMVVATKVGIDLVSPKDVDSDTPAGQPVNFIEETEEAPQPIVVNVYINEPQPTEVPITAVATKEATEEATEAAEATEPVVLSTPSPEATAEETAEATTEPTATPLNLPTEVVSTQTYEPFPLQPLDNDTNPFWSGLSTETDLRTPQSWSTYFNRVQATLDAHPERRDEILANHKLFWMATSPLVTGERQNVRTPYDIGLGWTNEVWDTAHVSQANFQDIFGSSWGTNRLVIESLANVGSVMVEYPTLSIMASQTTVEGFDQVWEATYVSVRAAIENHPQAQLWTEDRKEATALGIMNELFHQRILGSVAWGNRPMLLNENGQVTAFAQVSAGEDGFVSCRADGEPGVDDITEQEIILRQTRIIYPEGARTLEEMPYDRDARNDKYLVTLTLDSSLFANIDEEDFVNQFIEVAAYEIIGLGTLNRNPQPDGPNLIPFGWEVSGDTQAETALLLGREARLYRTCGFGEPELEEILIETTPVIPPPPDNTPPPETPTPPPTPEEEKQSSGETETDGTIPQQMPTEAPADDTTSEEANEEGAP